MTNLNVRSELQELPCDDVKELYMKECNRDAVMALNITGGCNVGMCVRIASLFGVGKLYLTGRKSYNRRPTVGQHNYIPIEYISASEGYNNEALSVEKIIQVINDLKQTYTVVYVEQGGISLRSMNQILKPEKPVLFVVGNEGHGIDSKIMSDATGLVVEIPQRGVGRSHNVANALSMVLWEYYRDTF